jgi:hypothetical protein
MFRAFSFVLALVLCTSVWSTAYAGGVPKFGPEAKAVGEIFAKEAPANPSAAHTPDSSFKSRVANFLFWIGVPPAMAAYLGLPVKVCRWNDPCETWLTRALTYWGFRPPKDHE